LVPSDFVSRSVAAVVAASLIALASLALPGTAGARPSGKAHLPDLMTVVPYDVSIKKGPAGEDRLFFSNTIGNIGDGPLELRPENDAGTGTTDAIQEIYTHTSAGTKPPLVKLRERLVGTFVFHIAHHHWHMEDFARYDVHAIGPDGSTGAMLRSTEKVSFCMLDTDTIDSTLEHYNWGLTHSCGQSNRQGLKVGKGDTYGAWLPDQFVDVTGLPAGTYRLVSTADPVTSRRPRGRLREVDDVNNSASVDVVLTGTSASLVAGSERAHVVTTPAAGDEAERLTARTAPLPYWCEIAAPTTPA
jgi:hypothetical protein